MTTQFYNKDYPRPQFVRKDWLNLNGEWDFSFDDHQVGESEHWYDQAEFRKDSKLKFPLPMKLRQAESESRHFIHWFGIANW